MTWKKIGDAASNVVRMLREDKEEDNPPEYNVLCDGLGSIVDDAVDENIPPWVVATALLHSLAGLISQMDPKADEEVELWLMRSVPAIFEWAERLREGAA
jgi:hypothetical protein